MGSPKRLWCRVMGSVCGKYVLFVLKMGLTGEIIFWFFTIKKKWRSKPAR